VIAALVSLAAMVVTLLALWQSRRNNRRADALRDVAYALNAKTRALIQTLEETIEGARR
jgi:cytochrome oxidase assembly protein ShyY1